MAGEGLVLHLGVDGVGAKQQVGKLVKEIQTELGKLQIDFSGKVVGGGSGGRSKGVRASIRNAAKEAASEFKNQQRILSQVIEAGVLESQRRLKRLEDRQRVEASRANRAGSFDPMAPFMNPQLSGRGLSGRTRHHLQQYKDAMRAEQRERDQIIRQQLADQQRAQRDNQRVQQQMVRQQEMEKSRYLKSLEAGSRELNSMILNPDAANYTTKGLRDRAEYVRKNIQGPRFARQQAAQRSQQKAFEARGGRGPDQKAIAAMFGNAGVYRAEDMRRQNRLGHRGNMMGMGVYQAQQMFEDYQYAGIRGMGNNLAFLGASVGGGAGMGIIGAALALQIGELTYKMLGYADAEEKAAKASELLTKQQIELIDVQKEVAITFASSAAKSTESYAERFEDPQKKTAREKYAKAFDQVVSGGKADPSTAIRDAIMADPSKYRRYADAMGGDVPGFLEEMRQNEKVLAESENMMKVLEDAVNAEKSISAIRFGMAGAHGADRGLLADELKQAQRDSENSRSVLSGSLMEKYPLLAKTIAGGQSLSGTFYGKSAAGNDVQSALEAMRSSAALDMSKSEGKLSGVDARLKTPEGAMTVAKAIMMKIADGDKVATELLRPVLEQEKKFNDLVNERIKANSEIEAFEDRQVNAKKRQAYIVERIRDAEQDTDRIMKSQLSTAEDMVDSYKRKVASYKDAKTSSSDSFGARMFGINRERTSGFLEQAGASPAYIQYRDDMIVQSRLKFLRGSADSAGKAGDVDRQIELLKDLQNLQMDMAGSDSRFGVASGFFNAASGTQKEIEAAYQTQVNSATSQQQAWQGVVNSLRTAQNIKIDPLSPDAFPKLQQYLAMLQSAQATMTRLNPGMAAGSAPLFAAAKDSMLQANPDFLQAIYNLFGAGYATGGLIGGNGTGDTVPAMLTPHEFVIRADVVKGIGVGFFEHLNRTGQIPRFADGGSVDSRSRMKGKEPWRLQAQQEREASKRRAAEQREWVKQQVAIQRNERLAAQAEGLMRLGGTTAVPDPRTVAEQQKVAKIKAEREVMKQARYDLFGVLPSHYSGISGATTGSPERAISFSGVAGAGVGGYMKSVGAMMVNGVAGTGVGGPIASTSGVQKKARRNPTAKTGAGSMFGGFGGFGALQGASIDPGILYGMVLSAPAPIINTWYSTAGFADRLMNGNYSGWDNPYSWWRSERFLHVGGGIRNSGVVDTSYGHRRGFHAFATGGMVQPFASSAYQPAIQDVISRLSGGSSGYSRNSSSTVNNNRSNIGSININVTGSGAVGLAIDQARRAQHAARLRKG